MIPGMLDGVRVLEMGGHVSAAFCAKLLGDYGADVIKAEPPGEGDEARRMGPFVGDDPHAEKSISFLYLNTNKRGITLDPASPSGKKVLASLVRTADVLIENFTPEKAEALGLTYESWPRSSPLWWLLLSLPLA